MQPGTLVQRNGGIGRPGRPREPAEHSHSDTSFAVLGSAWKEEEGLVAMAGGKMYSFEDVRKHNDRNDCWLIISGKVYDVTPFMEEHPGGDEVLLASTGKDATSDYEDIGHSDSAKQMMAQYCIGEVDAATIPAKLTYAMPKEASPKKAATSTRGWATLLQLAAPLLLLALAFVLQSFVKAKTE